MWNSLLGGELLLGVSQVDDMRDADATDRVIGIPAAVVSGVDGAGAAIEDAV